MKDYLRSFKITQSFDQFSDYILFNKLKLVLTNSYLSLAERFRIFWTCKSRQKHAEIWFKIV